MTKFKDFFKRLTDATKSQVKERTDDARKLVGTSKEVTAYVESTYAESGAKAQVDALQSRVSGQLDAISGQAMYQLVQERLAEQDRFNYLLATKLHEALERISALEKQRTDK